MTIALRLRSFRAWLDFILRRQIRFALPLVDLGADQDRFDRLQSEMAEFLAPALEVVREHCTSHEPIEIVDVGAKDFFAGPVLEKCFSQIFPQTVRVHGIEIDAYRRYSNFRSRADYGRYFAARMRHGFFHALNFLKWEKPVDVICLFHPFVSAEPLLRWGLPLGLLQPRKQTEHCAALLALSHGVLVVSNPTEKEWLLFETLAVQSGFHLLHHWQWEPSATSIQRKGRIGSVWKVDISR